MFMIMMRWRIIQMNKNEFILEHMIDFVEKKERELQGNKALSESQIKNMIVESILNELESITNNENN